MLTSHLMQNFCFRESLGPDSLANSHCSNHLCKVTSMRLQSDTHEKLQIRQERVKRYHDAHVKQLKPLDVGDSVRIRQGNTWIPATVVERNHNPCSYHVTTKQGKTYMYKRNHRHLLKTNEPPVKQPTFSGLEDEIPNTVSKPEVQRENKIYTRGWRWIRPLGLCNRKHLTFW